MSWQDVAAEMRSAAAALLELDTPAKGVALALILTFAAVVGAMFAADLGTSADGPILTETERG